ncbi:MAG: hypothetical protein NE330_20725 [Lentisphaeraceae bacterium]|nr:hypothetical protein [Lentisphaeraceae bacterium]
MKSFIIVVFFLSLMSSYGQAIELRLLGEPTKNKKEQARQIRQLFVFEDKLYLGHGDATVNTGPTDIISYSFKEKKFTTEFTVDDEGIQTYKVVDGQLVIPGLDATEDWKFGNIYVKGKSGWEKLRTLPKAVHVYDVTSFGGAWFATIGTSLSISKGNRVLCGALYLSQDKGKTWRSIYTTQNIIGLVNRINASIVYKDELYIFQYAHFSKPAKMVDEKLLPHLANPMGRKDNPYYLFMYPNPMLGSDTIVLNGSSWRGKKLIPDENVCTINPLIFKDKLILSTSAGVNLPSGHHRKSVGDVFPEVSKKVWAFDGEKTEGLGLKFTHLYDLLSKTDSFYALIHQDNKVKLAVTKDLKTWQYMTFDNLDVAPQSIEVFKQQVYLGLLDGRILVGDLKLEE